MMTSQVWKSPLASNIFDMCVFLREQKKLFAKPLKKAEKKNHN